MIFKIHFQTLHQDLELEEKYILDMLLNYNINFKGLRRNNKSIKYLSFRAYLNSVYRSYPLKKLKKILSELCEKGFIEWMNKDYCIILFKRKKRDNYRSLDNTPKYRSYGREAVLFLMSPLRKNIIPRQKSVALCLKISQSTVSKICKQYFKDYYYELKWSFSSYNCANKCINDLRGFQEGRYEIFRFLKDKNISFRVGRLVGSSLPNYKESENYNFYIKTINKKSLNHETKELFVLRSRKLNSYTFTVPSWAC